MSSYLQHIRQMERADWLDQKALELAMLLKAGESVSVGHLNVLTPDRVAEHADCNDLSRGKACDQLAAHYVETWAHHQWVNA